MSRPHSLNEITGSKNDGVKKQRFMTKYPKHKTLDPPLVHKKKNSGEGQDIPAPNIAKYEDESNPISVW